MNKFSASGSLYDEILYGGPEYVWILITELSSSHPPVAYKSEVAP